MKKLLFTTLTFTLLISFCSSEPTQEEIQAQIDAAVEQAVDEALSATSDEFTDKTDKSSTSTMPTVLAVPVGNYWGQYSDGTWAIVLSSEKPDNFEWAWDVFNREDPSGAYGFDEFDENSTLIGTLVDFNCSFNRISKTEGHKEVFGAYETTIEYYDTYFDWAEDNYDYLTEEVVVTISKIMRGVWTCDYDYLESISTEYLDFVHSGDAYADLPRLSEYIASFENNYDDDHQRGKYTYTLGALLYMTPGVEDIKALPIACSSGQPYIEVGQSPGYIWPMESINPQQLRENQVIKMSMFDNGITKSLIDGTYQGDDGSYGFRLKISSDGVWYSYKYTGHPWPSGYSTPIPDLKCETKLNPDENTAQPYKGTTPYVKGIRIEKGDTYDSFIIDLEIAQDSDIVPGGAYIGRCNRETCTLDPEMGPFIPDYVEEWLYISFNGVSHLMDINGERVRGDDGRLIGTFEGPAEITSDGSILHARAYGQFEGFFELHLGIIPGSTYRSYQTANPQTIVIEVDK